MHSQQNTKFCNSQQAIPAHQYKNIKTKLYNNNAAIWYNKNLQNETINTQLYQHKM